MGLEIPLLTLQDYNGSTTGPFPKFNFTFPEDASEWAGESNPIIPDEAWGYLLAGYAVYVAVSQYVSALSSFAHAKPKLTLLFQAIGAIVFAFVTIILALVLKLEDNGLGAFDSSTIAGIQFLRSTLLLGSIFMLFGFLVVFIPAVPFTVKRGTWKAKVVEAMQSDCMRMVALTAYTFMGAAQVAVASSIYIVATNVLELATTDALGMAVLYTLFAVFYMMVFASSMLGKKFKINGDCVADLLRKGAESLLEHKNYKYVYVVIHIMCSAGSLALLIYFFVTDLGYLKQMSNATAADAADVSSDAHVVAILFFVISVAGVLALVVQMFNDAWLSPNEIPESAEDRRKRHASDATAAAAEIENQWMKDNSKMLNHVGSTVEKSVGVVAKALEKEVGRLDKNLGAADKRALKAEADLLKFTVDVKEELEEQMTDLIGKEATRTDKAIAIAKAEVTQDIADAVNAEKERAMEAEKAIQDKMGEEDRELDEEIKRAKKAEQELGRDLRAEISRATEEGEEIRNELEEEVKRARGVETAQAQFGDFLAQETANITQKPITIHYNHDVLATTKDVVEEVEIDGTVTTTTNRRMFDILEYAPASQRKTTEFGAEKRNVTKWIESVVQDVDVKAEDTFTRITKTEECTRQPDGAVSRKVVGKPNEAKLAKAGAVTSTSSAYRSSNAPLPFYAPELQMGRRTEALHAGIESTDSEPKTVKKKAVKPTFQPTKPSMASSLNDLMEDLKRETSPISVEDAGGADAKKKQSSQEKASLKRTAGLIVVCSLVGAGCGLPIGSIFGVLFQKVILSLIIGAAVGAGAGASGALYVAGRCISCSYCINKCKKNEDADPEDVDDGASATAMVAMNPAYEAGSAASEDDGTDSDNSDADF